MQTITRANRVFPGKNNGLIVGYVDVLSNLQKALAIYAGRRPGRPCPVEEKDALVDAAPRCRRGDPALLPSADVDLDHIAACASSSGSRP